MVSPALIFAAVEVGGMVSNLVTSWNERRAGEYINEAQAFLQKAEPKFREHRIHHFEVLAYNARFCCQQWFEPVGSFYCEDWRGVEADLPPTVLPYLETHVLPKLQPLEALRHSYNSHHYTQPAVYRRVNGSLPADAGAAALLYGVAESIDGLMQSHGMKLNARQYYEEVINMGRAAAGAIDQAAEAIDAFFGMIAGFEPVAKMALAHVASRRPWRDLDEQTRLSILQFSLLYGLTVDFWKHVMDLLVDTD